MGFEHIQIKPRVVSYTFGGEDYDMDMGENLGYRTPFQDSDMAEVKELFDNILKRTSNIKDRGLVE